MNGATMVLQTTIEVDGSCSRLLSRKDAARQLGVAPQTLAQWACSGRYNLPYVKVGRSVKYRKVDIDNFIEANVQINGVADAKGWAQ
jgi:excisionase family DNA binding protein